MPRNVEKAIWTTFLNQETGVMFGTEKYAREYNCPVLFGKVEKMKRGFYEFEFTLLSDQPTQSSHGDISKAHTKVLEKNHSIQTRILVVVSSTVETKTDCCLGQLVDFCFT